VISAITLKAGGNLVGLCGVRRGCRGTVVGRFGGWVGGCEGSKVGQAEKISGS
jgi:hypothetical protein